MVHNYLEALLLNMLFLVVFLLFIPHLIETNFKNLTEKQSKLIFIASTIGAIISCMSFPIRIGDEIIMDLRTVAMIFGGLYLGKKASVVIVVIFVAFRLYLGGLGSGFYASLIASLAILIVLFLIADVFSKASKKKKVIIMCSFSVFISLLTLFIRTVLFNHLVSADFITVMAFITLHLLSAFFIVYFYEVIRETAIFNKRVINAEKLEVVSHLASSISHEVRNPLTVVKGFLQMLNQKELADDKREMYIELSLQEIDRANDIIGNYLTFAKPAPREPVIIDIKQELNRSINVISPLANMNCIDIQTDINTCYIKGESQLFQQCFLNITKNCIEAMPNGGVLIIHTEETNDEIVIKVTDNGKGMTNDQLTRLGEPFFTTKGREGTGLGMMGVVKIIKIMNGNLHVTSKLNEGTSFTISFPKIA